MIAGIVAHIEEPAPPMADTASPAAASAPASSEKASEAAPVASPDLDAAKLIDLLEALASQRDTRVDSALKRVKRYVAEHASGTYVPPRFIRKPEHPSGF